MGQGVRIAPVAVSIRGAKILIGQEDPYLKVGEVNDRASKGESEYVWALKDIDLEIEQGDVVGIIGKNGAGKSTLLKILSRVTKPTTGTIAYRGRIASLLEVGTGFHPEMTGRENIYMNGAIMGMTRYEITRKLDEIIAFAGVERYIDTPVKRYSSGMTVRLGFAVAAHLEPDILVVDEVLAVGDAEFQKKAIGKMQDVSKQGGRTVLFVSHNMAAVQSLCKKGILLENGMIRMIDDSEKVIANYLTGGSNKRNHQKPYLKINDLMIESIGVKAKAKTFDDPISMNDAITIEIKYNWENNNSRELSFTLRFKGDDGKIFMVTSSASSGSEILIKGSNKASMFIPEEFINEGTYFIDLLIVENKRVLLHNESDVLSFVVAPQQKALGQWMGKSPSYIKTGFQWQVEVN